MRIILPKLNEYKSESKNNIRNFSDYLLEKIQDDEFEDTFSKLLSNLEKDSDYMQTNLEKIMINWYDSNIQSTFPDYKLYSFRAESHSEYEEEWAWADLCFYFENFGIYIIISSDASAMLNTDYKKFVFDDLNAMRNVFKDRSNNKQKITMKNIDKYLEFYN